MCLCEQPQRTMLNGYNSQAKMVAQVGAVYNQPNFFGSTQSNHYASLTILSLPFYRTQVYLGFNLWVRMQLVSPNDQICSLFKWLNLQLMPWLWQCFQHILHSFFQINIGSSLIHMSGQNIPFHFFSVLNSIFVDDVSENWVGRTISMTILHCSGDILLFVIAATPIMYKIYSVFSTVIMRYHITKLPNLED